LSSEFIDAYSDDQAYLEIVERLINVDPVEGLAPERIKYSSFSRLWAVMMIGGVECMIKEWTSSRPSLSDIYAYFQNGPNAERIDRLKDAFRSRGLPIDTDAFEDYLAIKYIRNAYIHAGWSEDQREFVGSREFPVDLMHFEAEHLKRMKICYLHVMNNLGMAMVFDNQHT
jgi:hypothetical protein